MSSKPLGAAVKILPRRRASTTETPMISPSLLTTGPPLMPPREPEKFGTRRISAQAKTGSLCLVRRPGLIFARPSKEECIAAGFP